MANAARREALAALAVSLAVGMPAMAREKRDPPVRQEPSGRSDRAPADDRKDVADVPSQAEPDERRSMAEARAHELRQLIERALLDSDVASLPMRDATALRLTATGPEGGLALGMFDERPDPTSQEASEPSTTSGPSAEAQANNPLAKIVALNFQNYYIGELTDVDGDANQFIVRYAQPFSIADTKWLLRASLPVNSFPTTTDGSTETGLGDLNIFAAYLFETGTPAISFGLGPQVTIPTATDDALGSEKLSLGLANVLFDARSDKFQWGYLLTWQHSVAGPSGRADVNQLAFQPFAFYQLGDGWYLRSAPIWNFNLQNGDYSIPIGLGIGKVIKTEKAVLNFFVEPQFSIADAGPGQPEWQIFAALNLQFPF
jgi:hypothetical protein